MQFGDKLCWRGVALSLSVTLRHDMTGAPNEGSARWESGVVLLVGMTGNPGTSRA